MRLEDEERKQLLEDYPLCSLCVIPFMTEGCGGSVDRIFALCYPSPQSWCRCVKANRFH